ncbi:MAG: hypothetical protein CL581_17445 [Alteromonadaceae bacterium]|uniref:DUF4168 domain-containing protein n=1 Tax=Marinobacter sp. V034 TaxID=3459610 RepID=UPI000C537105|nr:hypothetical protein [Alteromonadaceae bacterium]MBH84008.1 hypothetical protein [Alteromonadaceae bacterium]|tara:strand:+ start:864 stop:1238 length:375 start_codon:yes stop_codon:yes gene_type:complete
MKTLMTSVALSAALLVGGPAIAQETQNQGNQTPAATGTQKKNYSDQELKKFVEVQENIGSIRDEFIPKIEEAESQAAAQELQMKANDKMVAAIQEEGMDIPTYNAIATAYNSEPQVRNRVDALM